MKKRSIRKRLSWLLVVAATLPACAAAQSTVEPTWESLNARGYPQWFSDAKLGIFVHWGLYSVPAYAGREGYGEWFYRGLMTGGKDRQHIMALYADTTLAVFEQYRALADHWHAELWKPDEWARLFDESGACYVMLVTKHHDGYSLWDDPMQPQWNSTMSGPHRNIVEELTEAVRRRGLRMCFYYSLPEWSNPRHIWMQDPDTAMADYVDNYMVPQFKGLVARYRPDAIFADGDWLNTPEQFRSAELIAWYYNTVGPDAIVNNRWGQGTPHGFLTPEYSAGIARTDVPWAECRGLGRSFGLNRNEPLDNYLTDRELIQHFCELVAHGGGLTLNVGPAADGTIPLIQQERLRAIGRWLSVNGEAIYGSRPCATPCQREQSSAAMPPAEAISFDWVRNAPLKGMPVDDFGIEWTADVPVPATGEYRLRLRADDEATVYDSEGHELLHYNHAWAENADAECSLQLEAVTTLRLRVAYRERDLEATALLEWSRDGGTSYEPIRASWSGVASWASTTRCFTQRDGNLYIIEFERPAERLEIDGMPRLPRGARIGLVGTSATNLRWRQHRDGCLVVDLRGVDRREFNALEHAWVLRVEGGSPHDDRP